MEKGLVGMLRLDDFCFPPPGGDTEACEEGALLAVCSSTTAVGVPAGTCVLHTVSVHDGKTDP
jgi:hypothetical protein